MYSFNGRFSYLKVKILLLAYFLEHFELIETNLFLNEIMPHSGVLGRVQQTLISKQCMPNYGKFCLAHLHFKKNGNASESSFNFKEDTSIKQRQTYFIHIGVYTYIL